MNNFTKYILGLVLLVIVGVSVWAVLNSKSETTSVQITQPSDSVAPTQPAKPVDEAHLELDKMTLEEKVSQMFLAGIYTADSTKVLEDLIEKKEIGSVILLNQNIVGKNVSAVTALLQNTATSSGQPPLLIGIDQEGGAISRIKYAGWELTSQPQIKSAKQAYDVAFARGQELFSHGVNVNFSPVLDYITNPSSFLYSRVFRGTREDASSYGEAMVKGYQDAGIAATIKHFPGHDNDSVDSHVNLPISQVTTENMPAYAEVFQNVMTQATPGMVMTGHILFPKIDPKYPATLSPTLIQMLRGDLHYDGVIITDDMNMGAITTQFGLGQAAKQAVLAGDDILMYVATKATVERAYNAVLNAVKNGEISEGRIDESVYRILKLKNQLSIGG